MKKTAPETERRVEFAALSIRAAVQPESINKDARTVDVVFSTGAPVAQQNFWTGERWIETLSLDPKHVRMGRINNGAPFLDSHSGWGVASLLGVVEPGTARLEKGQAVATVRFSKREDVEPVWQDVQDGILRNVSVGYRTYKYEQSGGTDGKPIERKAIDWEPFEISAVPMGADDGAKMRGAAPHLETHPCVIVLRSPQEELPMKPEDQVTETPAPAAPAASATVIDETRAAATKAERERIAAIGRIVRMAGLAASFGQTLIDNGSTLDKAREVVLDELAKKSEAAPVNGHVRVAVGGDEADKWRAGAAAWVIQRAGLVPLMERALKIAPAQFAGLALDPGEFRGLSLRDLARESLERAGVSTRGMEIQRLIGTALTYRYPGPGMQSTSDFAVLLENVMHKTLLGAYVTTPDTWSRFCATGSVVDFRAHNRYRMGTFGRLDRKNQGGEIRNKTIPDGEKQTITAGTRANIIGLSREAIVNDDMNAFSQLATMLGRAARLSVEMDVYDLLAENAGLGPNLNDGKSLFHADHENIGDAAELGVEGLDADRVLMGSQTDPSDNEILDLRPAVLLVPLGLGGTARVVNDSQYDPGVEGEANRFMVPNKVRGLFRDVVDSARLSGTRRYLFADPNIAPVLEVAFLEGQQAPRLESEDGWRFDGVEWKVIFDYAAAGVDFRGAVTNAG